MVDDLIKVLNDLIEANNRINRKLNFVLEDVSGLKEYFLKIGDLAKVMQDILTDALEKTALTNKVTVETLKRAGDFYKYSESTKYAFQNIMQEWFSDLVIIVISSFTDYDVDHVSNWLNLKFLNFTHDNKMPSVLSYEERVKFGESIFSDAIDELDMPEEGRFVLRTLYIPFSSLYYFKPMVEYPEFETWKNSLENFKHTIN